MRRIYLTIFAVASFSMFTVSFVGPASAESCSRMYNECTADAQRCARLLTRCLRTGCWYGIDPSKRGCGYTRR
jgi:hypothetical protein